MKSANTGKALSFLAYSAQERVYGGQSKCESAFTSSASCLSPMAWIPPKQCAFCLPTSPPSRCSACGAQDEVSNLLRMRDQGQMTGLNLDRLGLHPIGHETLQLGRNRPVFRGDGVPTRLGPPGRVRRLPRK